MEEENRIDELIEKKKGFTNQHGDYNRSLTFRPAEWDWVENEAKKQRKPKTAIVRKAVRLYMLVEYLLAGTKYPELAENEKDLFARLVMRIKKDTEKK
jgi:hypothetical protein